MLSSVSHDLKTPLASIMGSLSSLKSYKDSFSEVQKDEMLDIAVSESKRLDSYIDNVIQMLKVESGSLSLKISEVESDYFMNDVQQICSRLYPNIDIKMILPKTSFKFECDEILLKQVILILVDNAAKFAKDNDPIVAISLRLKNNNSYVFDVVDNGVGLSQKDLDSVFTIFHRLDKKDSYTKGNGLGLSICKGIVDAHHGSIKVYSEGDNRECTSE